ncbi:tetraspanin-1 [Osmerus mordax]|uniref:tetraspanin-1 n=1 Tax=Osmerus mordax TaxID=8014 RepID=UPI00350EECCA
MGCFTFVKWLMLLFNLLILLGGSTLLAVGIWMSVDGGNFLQILGDLSGEASQLVNVGFFCIAIGGVLVLMGFLGCCGAHKESRCLLLLFFSIILVIFIAELAAGVVALAYSSFAEGILKAWATPALKKQYGTDPVVTKMWNSTMTQWRCCGFTNYTDFTGSRFTELNRGTYPPSCCLLSDITPCRLEDAEDSAIRGCFHHLLDSLKRNAYIVGGVAAGICALEIVAMVVSMYLYCHLDDNIS